MTVHRLLLCGVAAALLAGCAGSASRSALAHSSRPPDPERWDRAACLRGEYPAELDSGALARARREDVQARQAGEPSQFAVSRLADRRQAFDARCRSWRSAQASAR